MKQKVLKLLEPMRDKTLSEGCEVMVSYWDKPIWVSTNPMKDTDGDEYIHVCWGATTKKVYIKLRDTEVKIEKVIGHPLTLNDLLRALGGVGLTVLLIQKEEANLKVPTEHKGDICLSIPLQHRHLSDIPEDHDCWEELYKILKK